MRNIIVFLKILFVFSFVIIASFLLNTCGEAENVEQYIEEPPLFTNFHYVPVYALVIDESGGKWFGTDNGLRYIDDNGTPLNDADDIKMSFETGGWVFGLDIDPSGGKWLCSRDSGVFYFNDNGTPLVETDDTRTSFNTETFQAVAIDASGGKWFATYINPYGTGIRYLDDSGTPANKFDDNWIDFTTADGLANNSVKDIAFDDSGGKWFGTYFSGGVSYLDDNNSPLQKNDDTWVTFTTADGLAGDSVTAIAIDPNGDKWFGIHDGKISYFDDNDTPTNKTDDTWITFTESDTLTNYEITSIDHDASGGIWVSSNGGGISYLDYNNTPTNKADDTWVLFTSSDGLPYEFGLYLTLDSNGDKWFIASCFEGAPQHTGGLVSYLNDNNTPTNKADDQVIIILPDDGLAYDDVNAIAVDASGGKWIGTGGGGISYLDDNGTPKNKKDDDWVIFTASDGLSSNHITAIEIDSSNGKWIGTYGNGVSYLDDNGSPFDKSDDTWITFNTSDGLVYNYILTIAISEDEKKWFGAVGIGVSYFDDNGTPTNKADDTWTTFSVSDGLSNQLVDAIAIDSSGGKWFGTLEELSYLNDNNTPTYKPDDVWTTFSTSDGLMHDLIGEVFIDAADGKWIGTNDGVNHLDDNGTPTNKEDDTWTSFTTFDGLLLSETVYSIAIDAFEEKWFGSPFSNKVCCLNDNGTPSDKTDDTWTTYTESDGLQVNPINAITIDTSNGKWIGTSGGVSYCP